MASKTNKLDDLESDNDDDSRSSYSSQANALSDEWKSHYNNLVWARDGNFPFWPSQITDPLFVPANIKEHILSHKFLGKRQIVYYYGTGDYGFIKPGSFLDYKSNFKEMSKQKVPKKYEKDFEKAIRDAEKSIVKVISHDDDNDSEGDHSDSKNLVG